LGLLRFLGFLKT